VACKQHLKPLKICHFPRCTQVPLSIQDTPENAEPKDWTHTKL